MKPKCKLVGENGNVFNLIAIVTYTLKSHGLVAELRQFDTDLAELLQNGGTYDDVLVLMSNFVEIS